MRRSSSVLGTLRTQAQFELAEVAAEVAKATAWTTSVEEKTLIAEWHCSELAGELSDAMRRSRINPALIRTIHGLHRSAHDALLECRSQLVQAREREEQVRATLAQLRNADRSLERAMQTQRSQERSRQQTQEMGQADDVWLQLASRHRS